MKIKKLIDKFFRAATLAVITEPPKWTDIDLPESRFSNVGALVQGIINWLLGIGGVLAVLAIIYSGIMYITAGGDANKTETAKKNLIWAITGLVVIFLMYAAIRWIYKILSGGSA